jgi:hypothetical protein
MGGSNKKSFILIDRQGQRNGDLHIKYAKNKEDTVLFTQTITPSYVATKTGKAR